MSSGEAKERTLKFSDENQQVVRESGGVKNDYGKTDWTLMPWEQLEETVKVLMHGANKYTRTLHDGTVIDGKGNWKKLDGDTYRKALARHVVAYLTGEPNDKDTNMSHLSHIIANCLFLKYFDDKESKQ